MLVFMLMLTLMLQLSTRLLSRRRPSSGSLHRNNKHSQYRGSSPHAPDGVCIPFHGNLSLLRLQPQQLATVPNEFRRLEQSINKPPPRRTKLSRPVEGEKSRNQIGPQDAVEDASAEGRAETGAEATKRCKETRGDVLCVGMAQVQDVHERIVDDDTRHEAAEAGRGDEDVRSGGRARQLGQRVKRHVEAHDGHKQRDVIRPRAANVQPADEQAAERERDVAGDEDGARSGGGAAIHGEHEDWRVEDDAHAAGEEAQLGEAREEDAARGEDGEGDDGVG